MRVKTSVLLFTTLFSLSLPLGAADWRPVTPEELAMKQSKSDANADAECLFRDVRIENNPSGSIQNQTTNYIRFKIFNDRGREKHGDVHIEYEAGRTHISDVAARTIHPDGTIIDVKKDSIFDTVEVKKGGEKFRVISFAFPAVEPGSVVEYKWTENEGETLYRYIPLDVQTEYPVDEVTFHIRAATNFDYGIPPMRFMPFRCNPERGNNDSKGFLPLTIRNVPAYKNEPYSPPGRAMKQWILVYYEENDKSDGDKYWNNIGGKFNHEAKEQIKVNGEMKQMAAEITGPGKSDEEKLALLAQYCRKNIKNIYGADVTSEEREEFKKPNLTSSDTFKRKIGTPQDIDFVFIALAQAAGYDARLARVADRSSFLFDPAIHSAYFVNNYDAAVQIGDKWKFYDVADEFAPPGTLAWREQGVSALLPDGKNSEWVQTPLLTSEQTKIQRIATLTLSPEGDIEGNVRELYWGNESIAWRIEHAHQNDAEREAYIREQLKARFADFEVKDIKVTVSPDASKPVGVAYYVTVKNYCQRTGKRLFLRPSFFTAGHAAVFADETRTNALYFRYPWSESDSIEIKLPDGFQLDHPEGPAGVPFPPVGQYMAKLSFVASTNTLRYGRSFVFGTDKILAFDASNYKAFKGIFDQVHTSDEHLITLKLGDPNAPPAMGGAAPAGGPQQQPK